MRIHDWLRAAAKTLNSCQRDSPYLSAQCLLAHVLNVSRTDLLIHSERVLSREEERSANQLLEARKDGEPVAYLIGEKEFYGRAFSVRKGVLIPRPETELIIDLVLASHKEERLFFADLGCGSGIIGLTLALERPKWQGLAIELSAKALAVALTNLTTYQCLERLSLIQADFAALPIKPKCCELMVANPPYVASREKDLVMPEVLNFEPHAALFAGPDGMRDLSTIISSAKQYLKAEGALYLEHGANQGESVRKELTRFGYHSIASFRDLAGHERVTCGRVAE